MYDLASSDSFNISYESAILLRPLMHVYSCFIYKNNPITLSHQKFNAIFPNNFFESLLANILYQPLRESRTPLMHNLFLHLSI